MEPKAANKLKTNVFATMAYFDMFQWPLTLDEIAKYLLWANADKKELWIFLNNNEKILRHGDYYFFKGRREIVETRREHEVIAEQYWRKAEKFVPLLQMIPFVKMAAVCNTLATNNTDQESDIDLFIVTESGRLFLARTLTTLLFAALGIRRHGNKVAGRFCLSFFVSEDSLNLENIKIGQEDIYLPFWILTMRPLFGEETYLKVITENRWIQRFFPRSLEVAGPFRKSKFLRSLAKMQEFIFKKKIGNKMESWLAQYHQERHQERLKTLGPEASVVVNDRMLKYHNVDKRAEIAGRFQQRFEELMAD
jgi:hypothetical protein